MFGEKFANELYNAMKERVLECTFIRGFIICLIYMYM